MAVREPRMRGSIAQAAKTYSEKSGEIAGLEDGAPFWAGGADKIREFFWDEPPCSPRKLRYRATLVGGQADADAEGHSLPLLIYFPGLAEESGIKDLDIGTLAKLAPMPFVLASPLRPKGFWWSISDDGDWGWIDGKFLPDVIKCFAAWIQTLSSHSGIDSSRVSALGFSAGAYAVTELIASPDVELFCAVMGSVHGHGQSDLKGVSNKRVKNGPTILQNWQDYLSRLGGHNGVVGGIFMTHNARDSYCPLKYAEQICDVLSSRQVELGLDPCNLEMVELDSKNSKDARYSHNYKGNTFHRQRLLEHLVSPDCVHGLSEQDGRSCSRACSRSGSSSPHRSRSPYR